MTDSGPDVTPTLTEEALVESFITFAASGDGFEDITFAAQVALGLADRIVRTVSSTDPVDPEAWLIGDDEFRGRSGPFSALDHAAGEATVQTGTEPRIMSTTVRSTSSSRPGLW